MDLIYISVAMSLDGFIDDRSPDRLVLSSPEDIEDMYSKRAECDAILIGAETVRKDNPSLLFKRPHLVEQRLRNGLRPELIKVTLTKSGNLEAESKFFTTGDAPKIILCPAEAAVSIRERLGKVAEIITINPLEPRSVISALEGIGVRKLFIEGGTSVLTAFISARLFHRLRVAVAPFFVGDAAAPCFVGNATFAHNKNNRLHLERTRRLGDMTVMEFVNNTGTRG